jgi:hypothetical protein
LQLFIPVLGVSFVPFYVRSAFGSSRFKNPIYSDSKNQEIEMRHRIVRVVLTLIGLGVSMAASAGYNTVATGTVTLIQQGTAAVGYTAGTFAFQVSGQPTVAGCGGRGGYFIVSSNSIPDAQTRANMLAILLMAYSTGTQVGVAYDNTAGFCDQTGIGVYFLDAP